MDHYIDIRVLPDPEFKATVLMNALFSKLHRGLVQFGEGQIGVSFPNHGKDLGDLLRLHGSQDHLDAFMQQSWLKGLRDYCQWQNAQRIPEHVQYRNVRRVQAKSAHNKRRRSVLKGWLSEEEAYQKIPEEQQKRLSLPYAQLKSQSNGNPMRIFIQHEECRANPTAGQFSSYGLSAQTTIPWF